MPNHNSSSPDIDETARTIQSVLLDGVERVGVDSLGMLINVDRSTISKLKTDDHKVNWWAFSKMLAHMGLKIVPKKNVCYSKEYVENLHYFANIGMKVDPEVVEKIMNQRTLDWSKDE